MFIQISSSQFADLIRTLGYADNFSYANTKALYDFLEERHAGEYKFDIDEICIYFQELSLAEVNEEFDLALDNYDHPLVIEDRIEQSGGIVVNVDIANKDNYRILINVS